MPVVVVANQKGGVGKTTTTLNLAAGLQEHGKRVLMLDLDPQANLTIAAGCQDPDGLSPSIGDLLVMTTRPKSPVASAAKNAIISTPAGLDLIPSNTALSAAELALVSALSREMALKQVVGAVSPDYDFVVIDCLPSLGLVAINALTASDGVIIPVQADFLAMQGLAQILETISAVQERLNEHLEVYGILLTMVDARTAHAREVVSVIRQSFQDQMRVFESEVRLQVVLKDSVKAGRSILSYDSSSTGAETYRALAAEVLSIVEGRAVAPIAPQLSAAGSRRIAARAPRLSPESVAEEPAPPRVAVEPPLPFVPPVATADTPARPAAAEPTLPPLTPAPPSLAPEPLAAASSARSARFADFLAGREAWLGNASE